MVYYWDEISGESRPVVPNEYDNPLINRPGQPNMIEGSNLSCSIKDHEIGMETWEAEYIADFPDLGIRIVVEQDGRAHTCLIVAKT